MKIQFEFMMFELGSLSCRLSCNAVERNSFLPLWEAALVGHSTGFKAEVAKLLASKRGQVSPGSTLLKACVLSPDFKEGKTKGVASFLLAAVEKRGLKLGGVTPLGVKDQVFVHFTNQTSSAVLRTACKVFGLVECNDR